MAHVSIAEIWVSLSPARIPLDIDKDGQMECIEIEGIELGPEAFEVEKGAGEYNLETGEIHLNFHFALNPDVLAPISEQLGLKEPVRFEIEDHGWFDLVNGTGTMHFESAPLTAARFEGTTITGCKDCDPECYATLHLGAWVQTPGSPPPPKHASQAKKEVWKHPNTPVRLLWNSTNSGTWTVDIQPDLGSVAPDGYQVFPDPTATVANLKRPIGRNLKFTADTKGGVCVDAHAEASINVCESGDIITCNAIYHAESNRWRAVLYPQEYDQNIKINKIIIDTGKPSSVSHPQWTIQHTFPGEGPVQTTLTALNNWAHTSGIHSLPGTYVFRADPPGTASPNEIVYFRLGVK
jgi:hypothetical protein